MTHLINKNDKKTTFLDMLKGKICLKLIIKLNKIINICSPEYLKEKVESEHNKVEDFKKFSTTFYENKDKLKNYISNLELINDNREKFIIELFYYYKQNDYENMDRLFKEYGFENKLKETH